MPKKKAAKRGHRAQAKIDLAQLEQLCAIHCTAEEIAGFFKVSAKTIERRRKAEAFAEVMERGYSNGRMSVRRAQMKLALAGHPTMLIWLGKQILEQRDVFPVEISGKAGGPVEISVTFLKPDSSSTPGQ